MKHMLRRIAPAAVIVSSLVACGGFAPQRPPVTISTGVDNASEGFGSSATSASSGEPGMPRAPTRLVVRDIANNCFTCHGPNGRSPGAIPSLNRLNAAQIAGKLADFKAGTQPSTVMGRHAAAYTDAEIDAVAAYIADLHR